MISSTAFRQSAWIAAGMATALGVITWLVPARVGSAAAAPQVAVPPGVPATALTPLGTTAEEIVLANVFFPSRTPPAQRYLPPELASDTASGMAPNPMESAPGGDTLGMSDLRPELFGTVIDSTGARALLRLDPAADGPRLYGVGDREFGYRVLEITPRRVVLRGPRGRLTLHLDQQENHP